MYIFESFRNALLFLGFGTGFLGFEDVFVTYDRTITLPGMLVELGDHSTPHFYKVEQSYGQKQGYNKQRREFLFDPIMPEARSTI